MGANDALQRLIPCKRSKQKRLSGYYRFSLLRLRNADMVLEMFPSPSDPTSFRKALGCPDFRPFLDLAKSQNEFVPLNASPTQCPTLHHCSPIKISLGCSITPTRCRYMPGSHGLSNFPVDSPDRCLHTRGVFVKGHSPLGDTLFRFQPPTERHNENNPVLAHILFQVLGGS